MSRHLMAKFRRTAFDWQQVENSIHGGERFRAPLENGHVLTLDNDPEHGWNWALFVPGMSWIDSETGEKTPTKELLTGGGARWQNVSGNVVSTKHLPTREHAQAQAEEAYRRMYPLGTDTGPHDSGVDYKSIINAPREDLDDDYGDIFGGGR